MKLKLNPISLVKFTHIKESKTFVSELSELTDHDLFHPLYDDACDVGFDLVNPSTGVSVTMVYSGEERDDAGELVCHFFVPIEETVRKNPRLNGYKCVVYND